MTVVTTIDKRPRPRQKANVARMEVTVEGAVERLEVEQDHETSDITVTTYGDDDEEIEQYVFETTDTLFQGVVNERGIERRALPAAVQDGLHAVGFTPTDGEGV